MWCGIMRPRYRRKINGIMVKGKVFSLKAVHQQAIFFAAINGDGAKAIIQFRSLTCVSRGYVCMASLLCKREKKVGIRGRPKRFSQECFSYH